jgi:Xaa-Pro aminopeptidase
LEIVILGISGMDASIEIESAMRSAGGQPLGIRAAVLTGMNSHVPFARPTAERTQQNDMVLVDITVSHSGYFAELARTFHLGIPSMEQRKAFLGTIEASQTLERMLVPGKTVGEIADKTASVLRNHDGGLRSVESYGSSIGLSLREPPQIHRLSEVTVREGMVFSVHPTLYTAGSGAARIGDLILVTADGPENLTSVSRETM